MKCAFLDVDTVGDVDFSQIQQVTGAFTRYTKAEFEQNSEAILADIEVIITNKVVINEDRLKLAPNLKLICVAATGYNIIDLTACEKHQVVVCNVTNYATNTVAQHVFALLLSWANQIKQYHQASVDGTWQRSQFFCLLDFPIFELAGKTLGIIGYGASGQKVAEIAKAFGMKVLIAERENATDLRPERTEYKTVLAQADIISLHCPLTAENANFINTEFFQQLKPNCILVNTARGGLINEEALYNALSKQQIQAALLDGLSVEPAPHEHILIKSKLPNLIITPHTAWASQEARQVLIDEIAINIQAFIANEPRNRIGL